MGCGAEFRAHAFMVLHKELAGHELVGVHHVHQLLACRIALVQVSLEKVLQWSRKLLELNATRIFPPSARSKHNGMDNNNLWGLPCPTNLELFSATQLGNSAAIATFVHKPNTEISVTCFKARQGTKRPHCPR